MGRQKFLTQYELLQLFNLAFEINGLNKQYPKPTIFIDFGGHVDVVHVSIHKNGWKPGNESDISYTLYTDSDNCDMQKWDECRETLKRLKSEKMKRCFEKIMENENPYDYCNDNENENEEDDDNGEF